MLVVSGTCLMLTSAWYKGLLRVRKRRMTIVNFYHKWAKSEYYQHHILTISEQVFAILVKV
jgi:hypothetical protein